MTTHTLHRRKGNRDRSSESRSLHHGRYAIYSDRCGVFACWTSALPGVGQPAQSEGDGTDGDASSVTSSIHELIHAFNLQPDEFEVIGEYWPSHKRRAVVQAMVHETKAEAMRYDRSIRAPVKLYSDGSARNGKVGAAATLFRNGRAPKTLQLHMGSADDHTVYEAELVGMRLAVELLEQEPGRLTGATLGADNQAALCSMEVLKSRPGHYLVQLLDQAVRKALRRRARLQLTPYWLPGHVGLTGNEYVDERAKEAAAGVSSARAHLPKAFRRALPRSAAAAKQAFRTRMEDAAKTLWALSPRYEKIAMRDLRAGRPARFFHKAAAGLSRRQHSMIVHLRTGHVGLNAHLKRIGKAESGDCPHCVGQEETVTHFLLECPHYAMERRAMQRNHRTSRSLVELLTNPDSFKKVAHFVDATQRLQAVFGTGQ